MGLIFWSDIFPKKPQPNFQCAAACFNTPTRYLLRNGQRGVALVVFHLQRGPRELTDEVRTDLLMSSLSHNAARSLMGVCARA